MLPNRCQHLNKFVCNPHKHWLSKVHFITRTLFPVRCKSCFTLLFLANSYHFDAFLSLVYVVSKLVYPNCTQTFLLNRYFHRAIISYTLCSQFIFVFAYAYPIPHSIQQKQVADTEHLSPLRF